MSGREEEGNLDNRTPENYQTLPVNSPITIVVSAHLVNNSLYRLYSPYISIVSGPYFALFPTWLRGKIPVFQRKLWALVPVFPQNPGPGPAFPPTNQSLPPPPKSPSWTWVQPPISHHRPRYGLTLISLTTPPQTTSPPPPPTLTTSLVENHLDDVQLARTLLYETRQSSKS